MDKVLFIVGDTPVTLEMALYGAAALFAVLLVALLVIIVRQSRSSRDQAVLMAERGADAERQLASLLQVQSEMTGRMQTMAEIFGSRTSDLARMMNERMDAQGQRLGQALTETSAKTTESLGKLNERLAVIDRAQTNITALSENVVSLQSILANKQTRGAFGQGRMEAIIVDALPAGGYEFQHVLSNNSRPDCVIFMPNGGPRLVIDAKFPLESWQRVGSAEAPDDLRAAQVQFKNDMQVHIRAISEKYLIAGETQDTAFLFVPSESIFADIHEHFDDVVQRAARARVVIVSPSLLLLSVQVVQALLRDVKMREQAHLIQKEVTELLADVSRLDDRVRKLQTHFNQANDDIGNILTSTGKLTRRGERIESMEFEEPSQQRLAGE